MHSEEHHAFAQSVQKSMQWKIQITSFYHENSWPMDSLKGSQEPWEGRWTTLWEPLGQRKETNSGMGKRARLYVYIKAFGLQSNGKTWNVFQGGKLSDQACIQKWSYSLQYEECTEIRQQQMQKDQLKSYYCHPGARWLLWLRLWWCDYGRSETRQIEIYVGGK